jgi:hypothetical protein
VRSASSSKARTYNLLKQVTGGIKQRLTIGLDKYLYTRGKSNSIRQSNLGV